MATRYICDHCGQRFTGVDSLINVTLPSSAPTHNNAKLYELCRSCIQALHDYLKPVPTVSKHKDNCASQSAIGGQGLEFIPCDCGAVKKMPSTFEEGKV